ncbi:hypothetical protein HXX76_005072 [Chlamydomonas incerta]|uniref:phytol kinase n=1 Tax=Chlamydomonas incerta TaxID=51695 RepID=A0A835W7L1_CHLIN|nr:hypothetical protein HXX76_005072 [Chlamydomonas incerta]|eukprot:KAG2438521.1 hypothetical protein HXX76_005072 [Chlamydomonas incerta]
MRRNRAVAGAAAREQKSAVERDLSAALTSLLAGQGLQRHLVTRLGSSQDEMVEMEQSPASKAALLAVLGWAAREATTVAQALQQRPQQQQQPRPGPHAGASEEELLRLLQLVDAALAPLAVLAQATSPDVELRRAVARTQLPQALVRLLAALCPPGFRCCGTACGRGSGSRGGAGVGNGAGLEARLDVVVGIAILSSGLWIAEPLPPELAACLTESHLVDSVVVALLRAQVAECGQQQQQQQERGGGAGAGPSTAPAGIGRISGSCYGAWLRGSKRGNRVWTVLRAMLRNVVTAFLQPRTWHKTTLPHGLALTLPHCREALSGPAIQLLLGRVLVAETNRCLAEAQAEAEEDAAEAGGSTASSSRDAATAAAGAAAPGLYQQRWHALPECLRSDTLPLPRNRSSAADLLLDVSEIAGSVWDFIVSGPRLPRLGQQPPNVMFGDHPAAEAVRKVVGGVATPEEEAAVAAAEAQLPPLHPPSYTAVQVYELAHAALTVALAHAPAEAECLSAPSLLARLVMELPPRLAAARLPGLWRTLSCALPRLACGADDGNAFQGPFWKFFGMCRSQSTQSLLSYLGLLLQLQLSPGPAAAAQPNKGPAAANPAAATVAAGSPAAPSGAAAPGPGPGFSLRCALRGGLLPAIEALLRRLLGRTAAVALAGPQQAAGFMDAAQQIANTVDHLLRTSGVWPAVLAHGPPQQVASLVCTMGKALGVVGDTFHALRQRPQLLEPAMQLLIAVDGNDTGQRALFDVLSALLEQARCMTDQGLTLQRGGAAGLGGGWHVWARRLPINDSIGPDGFALHTDWVADVGGCPFTDTAAAHQQRVLADWAVQMWIPELTRQTDRDGPTHVYSAFTMCQLLFMACQVLWPALRESLIASDAAAAESAAAITPPCDAAANAAGWRRFLLHDLDALAWTERLLVRTAASTELKPVNWLRLGVLGLTVLSVSQVGVGREACDAAADSTSVAAASWAAAECNSDMQRQQGEQQRNLLQQLRRISHRMGGEWPATVEGIQLSLPSEAAAEEARGAAAAPAVRTLQSFRVPELLLQQLGADLDNPYLLIYGGVPPAPDAQQVGALLGDAGLALCGNPACRSLEGDSEAGLMAAPAPAGRQQGGGGGRIKTCSRCRAVRYCCGACQLQHWATGGHKEACAGAAGVSGIRGGGQSAGR